jgi:hypothetical protein
VPGYRNHPALFDYHFVGVFPKMNLKRNMRLILNRILNRYDLYLLRGSRLYDWQKTEPRAGYRKVGLPEGAADYLRWDNPRLIELEKQYAGVGSAVTFSVVWDEGHVSPDDITYFRGDNAYVWQSRLFTQMEVNYILTAYYIRSIDSLGLLDKLIEDNDFGVINYTFDGKVISRDLLDSILEIYFLEKHLNISDRSNLNILDIGAGYGRLGYRMVQALPNLNNYLCTDAIPASTFICEYYLHYRRVDEKARAVPLHEIDSVLAGQPVDIAVNIHSFSECTVAAVAWWIDLLVKHKIKYLMIIPDRVAHEENRLILPVLRTGEDFLPVIENGGYHLIVDEPSYDDPNLQKYGLSPRYHLLFELR